MEVLLVEPWYGGSHRAWADAYVAASAHNVRLVTHQDRFWRWRLRGGSVTMAEAVRVDLLANGPVDVVVVSSGIDVAQLLGLLRRDLSDVPVALYLHETQVTYPRTDAGDMDAAWRSWTSLVAADVGLINSEFHRAVLVDGLQRLLADTPDRPHDGQLDRVVAALEVIPVGVAFGTVDPMPPSEWPPIASASPLVLWNHRWDPDKNPDVFVRAVERLLADGARFRVVLAGEDAWPGGQRRRDAAKRLGDIVVAQGPFDREEYQRWLHEADVVVSVADHEYFGISVVEAIEAGCVPVLPADLSYRDIVPVEFHTAALYEPGGFRRKLMDVVEDLPAARNAVDGLAASMERFDHRTVARMLDTRLETLAR